MEGGQRRIVLMTSFGKRYRGKIDLPNLSFRTTDIMNAPNVYWKSPNHKCFDDAILMCDVELFLEEIGLYKEFNVIQVRIPEVVFYYDDLQDVGDNAERLRATSMREKANEQGRQIQLITSLISNSFYIITGTFYGLFKQKSSHKFIPLSDAIITEVKRQEGRLVEERIELPHGFVGVSTRYIEALS